MNQAQQRQLVLGIAFMSFFLLLDYGIPNFVSRFLNPTLAGGMTLAFVYWIFLLAPAVVASALCVGFMRRKSPVIKVGLFFLGVLASGLLTSVTITLGALSDSQVVPGIFWRILSLWWIYAFGVVMTGFIVLLEHISGIIAIFRNKQGS